MKKLKNIILILGIALGIWVIAPAVSASAASVISVQCDGVTDSKVCSKQNDKPNDLITNIVNTLLFIVGGISVIMIIISGILYMTSAGDSGRVTTAKNTLTYAIVGLVVAFLAFAIVNYVVAAVTKK